MSIFSGLTLWRAPKLAPPVVNKTWKTGMWVMFQNKPALIAGLNEQTEIHYVDPVTGETTGVGFVPMNLLRQARYNEIPTNRRPASAALAMERGYGA